MKRKKSAFFSFLTLILVASMVFPSQAFAKIQYPNEGIKKEVNEGTKYTPKMMDITSKDIKTSGSLLGWLYHGTSYYTYQDLGGIRHYYFNTPNLQQSVLNFGMQNLVGGLSIGSVNYETKKDAKTASQMYGYKFPWSSYSGENPVVFLDVQEVAADALSNPFHQTKVVLVAATESLLGFFKDFLNFFGFNFGEVDLDNNLVNTSPKDVKNIKYLNQDYEDIDLRYNEEVDKWLRKNWSVLKRSSVDFKVDGKSIFDDGVVVSSKRSPKPGEVIQKLSNAVGSNYGTVISSLSKVEGTTEFPQPLPMRIMPYSIYKMSNDSKKAIGVADPRVAKFGFFVGQFTGLINVLSSTFSSFGAKIIIDLSADILSITAKLNSICDFSFLKANGVDVNALLGSSMNKTILMIILIATVIRLTMLLIKASGSRSSVASSVASAIIIGVVSFGLFMNPELFTKTITRVTSTVTQVSASLLKGQSNFSKYYASDASLSEIAELRYWYANYSNWASYTTNHSLNDKANLYKPDGNREYYRDSKDSCPKFHDGKVMDDWSAVLLKDTTNKDFHHAYRVIDHFMAPRIGKDFKAHTNENFNGYVYSRVSPLVVADSISIFMFTFLKVLCFLELVVNLNIAFFRVISGIFGGKNELKGISKDILKNIVQVIAFDTLVTLDVFIMSNTQASLAGAASIVIILLTVIVFKVIMSDDYLAPSIFSYAVNSAGMFKDMLEERSRYKDLFRDIDNATPRGEEQQ